MKRRIISTLIAVGIILVGVFGANAILASQSRKASSVSASVPTKTETAQPVKQTKTVSEQANTVSPAPPSIVMASEDYMPSNSLNAETNLQVESFFKQSVKAWVNLTNNGSAHKSDSLVNGTISFGGYVGKMFDPFDVLYIEMVLPVGSVYGQTKQVYTDTIADLNSFMNYLQGFQTLNGYCVYIVGKDGKRINYGGQQFYVPPGNVGKPGFTRSDSLWTAYNGTVWQAETANPVSDPSDVPEIQSSLTDGIKQIYQKYGNGN